MWLLSRWRIICLKPHEVWRQVGNPGVVQWILWVQASSRFPHFSQCLDLYPHNGCLLDTVWPLQLYPLDSHYKQEERKEGISCIINEKISRNLQHLNFCLHGQNYVTRPLQYARISEKVYVFSWKHGYVKQNLGSVNKEEENSYQVNHRKVSLFSSSVNCCLYILSVFNWVIYHHLINFQESTV